MKDFGSDKKPLSFDQYDSQSPKLIHSSPNADIEYLLSYISLNEGQQLNLTVDALKQETDLQTISTQTLCKYITKNSNLETGVQKQRQTVVSIVDLGIQLISGIKRVMQKRKMDQQKNKGAMNSWDMFKELFVGKQGSDANEYGGEEFGKRKSADVLIEQLRIRSETEMILARGEQSTKDVENGQHLQKRKSFLLINSLREKAGASVKQAKKQQEVDMKVNELDELLNRLEEYMQKNSSSSLCSEEFKKKLTEIWTLIEHISAKL